MPNIRYQSTFKNIDNIEYRISIIDTSYSGSVISDFEVSSDLFLLDYDSGEENYNPLVASQLTINFLLFNNPLRNDTTLFSFLKGMVQQNAQLYYIKIEQNTGSGFINYWIGNVVQNQSSYANASLNSGIEFQVIANDFGYLENKPFEQLVEFTPDSINLTSDQITKTAHGLVDGQVVKFISIGTITNIKVATNYFVYKINNNVFQIASSYENAVADTPIVINLTGATTTLPVMAYTDFGEYTLNGSLQLVNNFQGFGSDKFDIWNNINWFESSVTGIPSINILREISTLLYNFYDFKDAQNSINFIDIFKTVASLFGSRLIQSKGKYYLIQLQNYTASTATFRNASTSETINIRNAINNTYGVSALKILAGSIYSWVRPYASIVAKQPNDIIFFDDITDTQINNTFPLISNLSNGTIPNVYGGLNSVFKIDFNTVLNNPSAYYSSPAGSTALTDYSLKQHIFFIQYVVGATTYYLTKVAGVLVWQTTSATLVIDFNLTANDGGEYGSSFVTPELPGTGLLGTLIVQARVYIGSSSRGNPDSVFSSNRLVAQYVPQGFLGKEIIYKANLSPQPFDAITKELPELLLWDTSVKKGKGTMFVSASGNATNRWQIGSSSSFLYPIYELYVRNALALNYRAKQILEATIKGNYYPHELLTYDSIQWCIKRATFTAGSNQWQGEWFELTYNDSDIATAINTGSNGDFEQGKTSIVKSNKNGNIYDYMKANNDNLFNLELAFLNLRDSLQSEIATRGNNDNNLYKYIDFLLPSIPFIARTANTYLSGDTVTSITVDNVTKEIKTNDKLTIVNLVNGLTYDVIASANVGLGETAISINSYTFTADLLSTSLILFKIIRDTDHKFEIEH